jgi:hypothetical protein
VLPGTNWITCGFQEVMEAVDGKKSPNYQALPTGQDTHTPDPHATADNLVELGWTNDYKFYVVFPGAESYPDMIEKLGERVHAIKTGLSQDLLTAMEVYDTSLNESLRQAKGWRAVAYSEYVLDMS